jgi:hypothetical protein
MGKIPVPFVLLRALFCSMDKYLVDTWPAIIAGVSEAFIEMGMGALE